MKQLFIAIFLFVSVQTQAQVDTTKLPVTIQLKVKHIGYMADKLASLNTLADANLRDSLKKYLGSGNSVDSVVTVHLKAGYILNFLQGLFLDQSTITYAVIYEIGNGASGYTGIVTQLLIKGNNVNDPENGVARWLFSQIFVILNTGTTNMNNRFSIGKSWLQAPITQN